MTKKLKDEKDAEVVVYASALSILESYTDQLAREGPEALFDILDSLQGALKEVQNSLTRSYREQWLSYKKNNGEK